MVIEPVADNIEATGKEFVLEEGQVSILEVEVGPMIMKIVYVNKHFY